MEQRLLIIDANSLIHRAYHALPPFTDSSGRPTGALYGISSILIKILKEIMPEYAVAAFDRPEPTFREREYSAYKEHRPESAKDLISQLIASKEFFRAFGITHLESPGFEADDIIGTVAFNASSNKNINKIIILSGDLDVLQLVDGKKVIAWIPRKGISSFTEYGPEEVRAKLGVPPERITDYKGLVGDSSDNIPGVRGIGPKTAAFLIGKYGCLEDLYDLAPEPKTAALKSVIENKETALLSKRLSIISKNVPLEPLSISDFKLNPLPSEKLVKFLLSKGFRNLADRLISMKPVSKI